MDLQLTSVPFDAETFNALIEAQDSFVLALMSVMPRAQRQALSKALTTQASGAVDPMAFTLLRRWALVATQPGEPLRG